MNNESMVKIMEGISMLHETIVKALIPTEAQDISDLLTEKRFWV